MMPVDMSANHREPLRFAVHHAFPIVAETLEALVRAIQPGAIASDPSKAALVIATLGEIDGLDLAPDARVAVLIDHADRRPVQEARARGAVATG